MPEKLGENCVPASENSVPAKNLGNAESRLGNGDTLVADSKFCEKVDLNSGDKSIAVLKTRTSENCVPASEKSAFPQNREAIFIKQTKFAPPGRQACNAPLIDPAELPTWLVERDDDFLAFNKPGWVVCHPSKNGPWSSLVGAVREWLKLETLHLVSRLDRETSGIILIALNRAAASKSQTAVERHWVSKTYLAILEGELREPILVDEPLRPDTASPVLVKQAVGNGPDAQTAVTFFEPIVAKNGLTLARIELHTGRKHQIRAHAQHIGHCVFGDKLYGRDERFYLDFCENGLTPALAAKLPFPRQALHAARLIFKSPNFQRTFSAPVPADMRALLRERLDMSDEDLELVRLLA